MKQRWARHWLWGIIAAITLTTLGCGRPFEVVTASDALIVENSLFILVVVERGWDHATRFDHAGRKEIKNQTAIVFRRPIDRDRTDLIVGTHLNTDAPDLLSARSWRLIDPTRCMAERSDGRIVIVSKERVVQATDHHVERWVLSGDRKRLLLCDTGAAKALSLSDPVRTDDSSNVRNACRWLSMGGAFRPSLRAGWADNGGILYREEEVGEQLGISLWNVKSGKHEGIVRTELSALSGRIEAILVRGDQTAFIASDLVLGGEHRAFLLDGAGRSEADIGIPGPSFAPSSGDTLVFWPTGARILQKEHGRIQIKLWWPGERREMALAIDVADIFRLIKQSSK